MDRHTIILPDGARLKRISIGDFSTACSSQSANLMKKGENPATTPLFMPLINKGSAESAEELSWEGDLPCDQMQITCQWVSATISDTLRTRILVEWP